MRQHVPADDSFERRMREQPEGKLELMQGRLIVGNSIAGSRYLLWSLLHDLDLRAALALAPLEQWWQALSIAFEPPPLDSPQAWVSWAERVVFAPRVPSAGPSWHHDHYVAATSLRMGLSQAVQQGGIGTSLGRDFVMRLGDDAVTPDILLVRADRLGCLHDYYLDGPASLIIEVTMPDHEQYDEVTKQQLYATHNVPEYWIVHPGARTVALLRLQDGAYQRQAVDNDGRYQPSSVSGLVFRPEQLWAVLNASDSHHSLLGDTIFETHAASVQHRTRERSEDEIGWGELPFAPQIGLERTPIHFEQYISWCPEAKFERINGVPIIGGHTGTRNVLGLLLMTFGLIEAVQLQHPQEWVRALLREEEERRHDAHKRDEWWALARQAAALLREKHGIQRLAVIGDLVRPAPLHYWSDITLVAWNVPRRDHELYRGLYTLSDTPVVNLVEAEQATAAERRAIAREAVEL